MRVSILLHNVQLNNGICDKINEFHQQSSRLCFTRTNCAHFLQSPHQTHETNPQSQRITSTKFPLPHLAASNQQGSVSSTAACLMQVHAILYTINIAAAVSQSSPNSTVHSSHLHILPEQLHITRYQQLPTLFPHPHGQNIQKHRTSRHAVSSAAKTASLPLDVVVVEAVVGLVLEQRGGGLGLVLEVHVGAHSDADRGQHADDDARNHAAVRSRGGLHGSLGGLRGRETGRSASGSRRGVSRGHRRWARSRPWSGRRRWARSRSRGGPNSLKY